MHGTILVMHPEKTEIERIKCEAPPALDKLQELVGGYIEAVPHFEVLSAGLSRNLVCRAFCNEEGKLNQLPINIMATVAWHTSCLVQNLPLVDDVLCGTVIVLVGDKEFMEAL